MSTRKNLRVPKKAANTFGEHVKELRGRAFLVAGVFFAACLLAYALRESVIDLVLGPIGDQKLVYLTPAGGFNFIFSIILYAGLVMAAPYAMYQVYQFVKPALPAKARSYSLRVFLAAVALMLAGVCFGYFIGIPAALSFLTTFASDYISPNLTADSYLNFFVAYVVGLGVLFQLPIVLLFWNWISPIPKGGLLSSQRFVIVGAFILAALITPTPDVLNQVMVAGPIIVVYQLGVVAVFMMNREERKRITHA